MKKVLLMVSCLGLMLSAGMLVAQDKGKKGKAVAGNVAKGKEAFEQNCSGCHKADSDDRKNGPPGLKGLTKRAKMVNDEPMTDENVATFVNEGGNGMPGFSDLLTTADKVNILAYLKTI